MIAPHDLNIKIWEYYGYRCVAALPEHQRYDVHSIYSPENILLVGYRFTASLAWADATAYLPDYASNLHLAWSLYREYIDAGYPPLPVISTAEQMAYEICLAFVETFIPEGKN